jgi:biopolymer transport protein ExbD
MARRNRRHEEEMEINLIPMIDIMLILLIFFMVATTVKTTEKALPILLPFSAAAIHQQSAANLMVLSVDAAGLQYVDGEQVAAGAMHERIRNAAARNPEQAVRIDGDRQAPYERIVELIELCQFEGLRNINLHTRGPGGQTAGGN